MALVISGITWILSYRCNLNCRHCFFDVNGALRILGHDLARTALASLELSEPLAWQHVSGGEPLLFREELYRLLEVIQKHGSKSVGIASNGFWGESTQLAQQTVAQLKQRGVNGICLSVDDYHQEQLPINFVRTAAEQVAEQGLKQHSYVVSCHPEETTPSIELDSFALPLANVPVRKIGKGVAVSEGVETGQTNKIPDSPCRELCCCLGETTPFEPQMVWIDPYGSVMICYGLIVGNLHERSLGEILKDYSANRSPLLKTLTEEGPVGLYRLAVDEGWQPEANFTDECSLCWQARCFLRSIYPDELGPDECYPQSAGA